MALRSMQVRTNPLPRCPNPPRVVRLHRDPSFPASVEHVFVTLDGTCPSEQVTGTWDSATSTAVIVVGSGRWIDLSDWLGAQPFVVTIDTSAIPGSLNESVFAFDPSAAPPLARMSTRGDVSRDVFALRRDVSSIRSVAADILNELEHLNLDPRSDKDSDDRRLVESERVTRDDHAQFGDGARDLPRDIGKRGR